MQEKANIEVNEDLSDSSCCLVLDIKISPKKENKIEQV